MEPPNKEFENSSTELVVVAGADDDDEGPLLLLLFDASPPTSSGAYPSLTTSANFFNVTLSPKRYSSDIFTA